MPLWANLHGSFAFGLALAAALGVEAVIESSDRGKTAVAWAIFVAAATASCLLTPFGLDGLLFPLHLSAMHGLGHIGEWQPSDFSTISPFEIALLAGLGAFALGRIKVAPIRLLILLGIVWLALTHSRHQMLFGVTAPLLLAAALAAAWPARDRSGNALLAPLAAAGFAVLIAVRLMVPVVRGDDPVTPATALAHVPRFVRETPVLNDYAFGGYLIWNGVKPFIDSRADLYGDIFLDNYAAITQPDKDALAASLAYYHVRWTIFSAHAPVVKLAGCDTGMAPLLFRPACSGPRPRLACQRPQRRSRMSDDIDEPREAARPENPFRQLLHPAHRRVSISCAATACGSTRSAKAMTSATPRRCCPSTGQRGKVLLIRQFRWPAFEWGYKQLLIEVIAGKLDGDTPLDCVHKEAMEEAGVTLSEPAPCHPLLRQPRRGEGTGVAVPGRL